MGLNSEGSRGLWNTANEAWISSRGINGALMQNHHQAKDLLMTLANFFFLRGNGLLVGWLPLVSMRIISWARNSFFGGCSIKRLSWEVIDLPIMLCRTQHPQMKGESKPWGNSAALPSPNVIKNKTKPTSVIVSFKPCEPPPWIIQLCNLQFRLWWHRHS